MAKPNYSFEKRQKELAKKKKKEDKKEEKRLLKEKLAETPSETNELAVDDEDTASTP